MALLDLLKKSPDQVQDKQVQQLIAFAGGGKLIDDSDCSREFRAFLGSVPFSNLKDYADQCLNQTFTDSSLALQDIVNEIGARLGSDVTPGAIAEPQSILVSAVFGSIRTGTCQQE